MIANTSFEIFISAFVAYFISQLLKTIFYVSKNHKINFKIWAQMGGMPSSISSFVAAMTTSVGLINGFKSTEFAIFLGFTLIVMYDAAGLRRSTAKIGSVMNKIIDDISNNRSKKLYTEKLFELLGHTPIEVMTGALIGIVFAIACHVDI